MKKPEPAKPEPPKPAKTWGKAGSKKAEPAKEPEKKEEVSLKKAEPQPKKEEEKKVETPALKPTPKTEKSPQEEAKESVQLKPVKKEVRYCHLFVHVADGHYFYRKSQIKHFSTKYFISTAYEKSFTILQKTITFLFCLLCFTSHCCKIMLLTTMICMMY